jgi:two-component system, NtrC family, nitrogen regulation sensor histidine kinase NtrY
MVQPADRLITLFVLFVATWIALFLAKQISIPITALLEAASQVRKGNLKSPRAGAARRRRAGFAGARLQPDDAGTGSQQPRTRPPPPLHRSHPGKHSHRRHLHRRRRLHPARQPRAGRIFRRQVATATRLEDLFSREDTAEIKYLMKRARRTGLAARQMEMRTENRTGTLAVTVSALEEKLTSGFVIVLEDTSELLRAQKAAAWHEVARRVAHEIKNPLTPIALSAERIAARWTASGAARRKTARILNECAETISKSVESVKTLVDEFSQFARFPAAQPVRSDLNEVVRDALAMFHGRLDGIDHARAASPRTCPR